LFTMHFTALQVGSSNLILQAVELRDTANQLITPASSGGTVTVAGLRLSPTVLLQGPYDSVTTSMRTSLRTGGMLSARFPSVAIPAYAVDSVNIEIRDSTSGAVSTVRRFSPAWLLSDGSVRGFTDTTQTGVGFDAPAGAYYVVIRHRNHLAIMSSAAITLSGTAAPYDFTTGQDKAYGTNGMKVLPGSRYGMVAGDVNADGQLKYNLSGNDRALILTRIGGININATVAGYYNEDVNLDGVVRYNLGGNDRAIILQNIGGVNINATVSTQVPN
jgi:hypothetical protein